MLIESTFGKFLATTILATARTPMPTPTTTVEPNKRRLISRFFEFLALRCAAALRPPLRVTLPM